MDTIDILITHAHLFTMQGDGVGYIADGAVAVRGQRIAAVGTTSDLMARFRAAETDIRTRIDASDCAVLPGLVDAHIHTTLSIVRGVAQDVAHWMQTALAPYTRHITPEAALAGSRLNALEALKAGTTTFCDNGGIFPGWPQVYDELGARARLAPMVNGLPPGGMAGWKLGDVYPLDEPYINEPPNQDFRGGTIPLDEYFVLGDNRNNSQDSRDGWMVERDDIIGKAWLLIGLFNGEWGFVPNYPLEEQMPSSESN